MADVLSLGKILIIFSCLFTICAVYYSIGKMRIETRYEEILDIFDDMEDQLLGKPGLYSFFLNRKNDIWENIEYSQLRERLAAGSHWNFQTFPPKITLKESFCYRIDHDGKRVFVLIGHDTYDWESFALNLYTESPQQQPH